MLPLEGIRVIDWTIWKQGPVAASMLGDLGCDVIKIEDRVKGDPGRGIERYFGSTLGVSGRALFFEVNNRSKRSITLDLKKPEAKEIVHKLVEGSDVFIQNYRKGVAARLGMDYATLSQHNPRLIYLNASGWGPKGSESEEPAYDYTAQAKCGLMTVWGEPDTPPIHPQGAIGDQLAGMMGASAVVIALLARERLGIAQEVDVSLLGSLIYLQQDQVSFSSVMGRDQPKQIRSLAGNPLWNHYNCADGKWIVVSCLQPDRYWPGFCRGMGLDHLENDPKFETQEARTENARELIALLDRAFATRSVQVWFERLRTQGVICSPVNTITDATRDSQVVANGYVIDFDHPRQGRMKIAGLPMQFSKTDLGVGRPAPEFGEHTEQVLLELGYSWEEIYRLRETEVI